MVTTVRDGSRARRAPAENHGSLRATSDVEHLPALRGIIDQRQIQRCAHGLRTKAPQDAGVKTQLALVTRSEERRVGKQWVRKCRYRGSPDHKKKHIYQTIHTCYVN